MLPIMVAGAGKIGRLISLLLSDSKDYQVFLADRDFTHPETQMLLSCAKSITPVECDMRDEHAISSVMETHQIKAVISSLPYFLNFTLAKSAKVNGVHYFDLTEDVQVTQQIKQLANDATSMFIPQCGLAPGFVSIAAHSLMHTFESCHEAKLRVGALPQHANNALGYAMTWSTEGLINEYGEPCPGIDMGEMTSFHPLEGLETVQIEGEQYEAFYTSGGIGGLAEIYQSKVHHLSYKTMRYPGHCEKMRFLMNDLKLNHQRDLLQSVMEHAIPRTYQDMVLIYISVNGIKQGALIEEDYVKKIYPRTVKGMIWSAIQISTASSICAVMDLALSQDEKLSGLILQEHFPLESFLNNRFGQVYQ